MAKRIAVVGDPHACISEVEELYNKLSWMSLDEIWSAGDNIHRGPDDHATVEFIRKHFTGSVMGNHEETFLRQWEQYVKNGYAPRMPDKRRTVLELTEEDVNWIKDLPRMHIDDELGLVIVHAGLFPNLNFYQQPPNIVRVSMIHKDHGFNSRWWGPDAPRQGHGFTEEQSRSLGWRRWYEEWDHQYRVVIGHAVFPEPTILLSNKPSSGYVTAVDTGGCFGGSLSAAVFDGEKPPEFVSVKAKKLYYANGSRMED